jgi:hypothetical protein
MTNDAKKSYGRLPSKIQLGKYQGVGFGGYLRLSGTDAVTFGATLIIPKLPHNNTHETITSRTRAYGFQDPTIC